MRVCLKPMLFRRGSLPTPHGHQVQVKSVADDAAEDASADTEVPAAAATAAADAATTSELN